MNIGFVWDATPCSLVDIYQRFKGTCCLHLSRQGLVMEIEIAGFSEILVRFYQTARRRIPEERNCHNFRRENLKFDILPRIEWYAWRKWRVLVRMIGVISTSATISFNYNWYNAIADLHTFPFTVAHTLGFCVYTSRFLETDLNTETITSDHHEVFLSSITLYSSALICTQSS
jgi:hypothetical protein